VVRILVEEAGANINQTTNTSSTPLRGACYDGHLEIEGHLHDLLFIVLRELRGVIRIAQNVTLFRCRTLSNPSPKCLFNSWLKSTSRAITLHEHLHCQ
ncbi:hypothetical protein COOONC_20055, partial [Cooperia oncophora]